MGLVGLRQVRPPAPMPVQVKELVQTWRQKQGRRLPPRWPPPWGWWSYSVKGCSALGSRMLCQPPPSAVASLRVWLTRTGLARRADLPPTLPMRALRGGDGEVDMEVDGVRGKYAAVPLAEFVVLAMRLLLLYGKRLSARRAEKIQPALSETLRRLPMWEDDIEVRRQLEMARLVCHSPTDLVGLLMLQHMNLRR